jgi:hypothetical protein
MACSSKAKPAPLVVGTPAEGSDGAGTDTRAAAPDPACVSDCHANHPMPTNPEGYAAYCDEICTPPDEPSQQCVMSCDQSHEPGAHYDDNGDYVQDDDTRDEDQQRADHEHCESECASVPTLSSDAMEACVDACLGDGDGSGAGEAICRSSCDPDPYDQCRYQPCD